MEKRRRTVKKTKRTSFRGRISENAKQRERKSSFGYLNLSKDLETFSPKANTRVVFDILPYEVSDERHIDLPEAAVGELWYKKPFKIHRNIGADRIKVVCPTTFGKRCPICEYRNKLIQKNGYNDEAAELNTSNRSLYAIMVKGKNATNKIQVFDTSDYYFQEVLQDQLMDTDEFEYFPDHAEGVSVEIRFGEKSFAGQKFAVPTRFDWRERKEQYDDSILDEVPNLDELLIVLSYEELKEKFFEMNGGGDDDPGFVSDNYDEDDEDWEDDADDEDWEDEEPEPEKPKRKAKVTSKPPVKRFKKEEQEDDEDYDDEDWEDGDDEDWED